MPVYLPGLTFGSGYGGASYGSSPYGGAYFPRPPVPVSGGFGGSPYSYYSYGALGGPPPRISTVVSVSGFVIRIYFSEEMSINSDLLDSTNYIIHDHFGVPTIALNVTVSSHGTFGATSVEVEHTGTTLGGNYTVQVRNLFSNTGFEIKPPNDIYNFNALGDITQFNISHVSKGKYFDLYALDSLGRKQNLLTEVEFSPGVNSLDSYGVQTEYPIIPIIQSASQDSIDASLIHLEMYLVTEAEYNFVVGPAEAFTYNGLTLPEDDTSFSGSVIGTGDAVSSQTGLYLSKSAGDPYGYSFGDLSGKILPNSAISASITFDATTASISPSLEDKTLATYSVSDGVVEIHILLRDISGNKFLEIVSGTYSTQIPCAWDQQETTITLIRNQVGGFYSVLCQGYPEITFDVSSATGSPVYGAGAAFVFTADFNVSLFRISDLTFTSSQTVYTTQWNFQHSVLTPFTGTALSARNVIRTKRGPLVRGWGDNTPARKQDVEVRVNGTPIEIAKVNPYIGEIYPVVPIPLAPSGVINVEIDYIWFQNPAFPLIGLNTQGLSLNTWSRSNGRNTTSVGNNRGVQNKSRFPMGISLGPGLRETPKKIGHRYIGFQNQYSALLNKDSLLLLNKNPNSISDGSILSEAQQQKGLFNGQVSPGLSDTPWSLSGLDLGQVIGDGTYRLVDSSSGSYSVGFESIYSRELDLSVDCQLTQIARFKVEDYQLDGVFTGVGFGVYDGADLGLIGAVVIDGVEHFGLLLDGSNPQIKESWEIGFAFDAVAFTQNVIRIPYSIFPKGVEVGNRFRINDGAQAGVYTIAECGLNLIDDYVEITLKQSLPASISITGNESFVLYFETKWSENLSSFRLQGSFPKGSISVNLSTDISGVFLQDKELTAYPAQTALLIPAYEKGSVFWGSISRKATNSSIWDIVQYLQNPDKILNTSSGITVLEDMSSLPEEDELNPWYIVSGFGNSHIESNSLHLQSNSSSIGKDTSFYYQTVEPYLSNKTLFDLETRLQVVSGNSIGDAQIQIRDGVREVSFKTLRYLETPTTRKLITDIPTTSISGLLSPEMEGWNVELTSTVNTTITGQILSFSKAASQQAIWSQYKSFTEINPEGCILRWESQIHSSTVGSRGIGFSIGVELVGVSFNLTFDTGVIRVEDKTGSVVWHTFIYGWNNAYHEYKLTADPISDTITLLVDGALIGSFSYSVITDSGTQFGNTLGFVGTGLCEVSLNALAMIPLRSDANEKKTLGIQTRYGDPDSIDGYVIPRSDNTSANNSSLVASPIEMDFESLLEVRVLLNPSWGVSLYRPDINMPNGDPYVAGTTDPNNAWVNVEYRNLPVNIQPRGSVSFGSLNSYSVSEQVWDYLQYRVKNPANGFGIAPTGMVLNRATKITSGEHLYDTSPEDKQLKSRTSTLIYVPDCAIYADRVFKVLVDGLILPTTEYTFDKRTQYIVLSNPLPSNQYSVRVIFAVGSPITKNYLCEENLDSSVTLLNSGTPPIPKNSEEYSDLQFCTKEEGSDIPLSSICDDSGFSEIGIDGHFTTDSQEVEGGPAGPFGKSSPTYKGSSTHHSLPMFMASGGGYSGTTLNATMLYPNQQVPSTNRGMGINQDFTLRLEEVREDILDVPTLLGDNVPPTYAEPLESNPDGTPGTFNNGAVAYLQEDYDLTSSRLGPWGGITSLGSSLLGGGSQISGAEFILEGGAQITRPVRTSGVLEAAS